MTAEVVRLGRDQLEAMVEHARREVPREACGILGGRDGRVERVYPARNARTDSVTYYMEPEDQLRIFRRLDEEGLEQLAIYHSHPASPAYPSPTDVAQAFYPEAVYLIVSLAAQSPEVRGFRIEDGQIREVTVEVDGEPGRGSLTPTAAAARPRPAARG